jgi:hypothetical protein
MAISNKVTPGESGAERVMDIPPEKTQTVDPETFNPIDGAGARKPFVWTKCKSCQKVTAVIKETEMCHDCTEKHK